MGIIWIAICIAAAFRLYHTWAFVIALLVAVANALSFGLMLVTHELEPEIFPLVRLYTSINVVTTLIGVGLLIYSFVAG